MKQLIELKEPLGKITDASDVFKKIKKINIEFEQENFLVVFLNRQLQVLDIEVLFKGGCAEVTIDPKIIFRKALLKNAQRLIIAHNHPSGHLKPSYEDEECFRRLKALGQELNLQVLDSIIFNQKEFYSILE